MSIPTGKQVRNDNEAQIQHYCKGRADTILNTLYELMTIHCRFSVYRSRLWSTRGANASPYVRSPTNAKDDVVILGLPGGRRRYAGYAVFEAGTDEGKRLLAASTAESRSAVILDFTT